MLAIAILLLLCAVATTIALIAASPLFRAIALAVDSWADGVHGKAEQLR